jgi:hypothetical protein
VEVVQTWREQDAGYSWSSDLSRASAVTRRIAWASTWRGSTRSIARRLDLQGFLRIGDRKDTALCFEGIAERSGQVLERGLATRLPLRRKRPPLSTTSGSRTTSG